jgi:hypothetical protein
VRSSPVGTALALLPACFLKRSPSLVNHLRLERLRRACVVDEAVRFAHEYFVRGILCFDASQLERSRQVGFRARLEPGAVLFATLCYQDVVWVGGGEQTCICFAETSERLGITLGEIGMEEFTERIVSNQDCMLAFSCISNVFDQLGRTSEDIQFVTVCAHACRWCIGEVKDQARQCDDPSAAMELVSRVTGIADLDELLSSLEQGSGRREGSAERNSDLTTSGALWHSSDTCQAYLQGSHATFIITELERRHHHTRSQPSRGYLRLGLPA